MKIAVLTSGGVDSSVALRLLKGQGHELKAFYLKIWLEDELQFLGDCPWEEDLKFVREICQQIDVPLEIIPLQKEYFDTVVKYTIDEVKAGRTPNPDVMCNNNIKFGLFWEKLKKLDPTFEKIATGHYAQVIKKQNKFFLKKAPDPIKDQTYFLANLKQKQLKKLIFPIGHLTKEEVRRLADKYNLPNKNRKDSQGICFLGKFKYKEFIRHYLGEKKGDLIEFESGKKMGEHEGFYYFTIGQRQGINLSGGPWYVVKKDIKKNIIYISRNYHEEKERNKFFVSKFNWFAGKAPSKMALAIATLRRGKTRAKRATTKTLQVKLRHGEKVYDCKIKPINNSKSEVTLNESDQGIAKGQFAVFYDGEICLGSAVIS